MRIRLPSVAVSALLPLLSACGPSQAEYDKLRTEMEALATQADSLRREVDELQNGAPRRLAEIQQKFEAGDWAGTISLASALRDRHPGSPEAKQGWTYLGRAQDQRAAELKREAEAAAAQKREAEKAAAERKLEAEKSARDRAREIIRVSRVYVSRPNSASGVDLEITFQNRSKKTIKYASFSVEAFNAVGDPVECTIRGYSKFTGQMTGPLRPGAWHGDGRVWEAAWYNPSIVKGVLRTIQIEYTDGSSATLSGEEIGYVRY